MQKIIWSTLIALILLTANLKADHETHQSPLPKLEPGYNWQSMPMVCASGNTIVNDLTAKGFVPVNMSLGRKEASPEGEPMFLVTYFINQDATATAATMNIPISTDTCLLFLTHDLVVNRDQ